MNTDRTEQGPKHQGGERDRDRPHDHDHDHGHDRQITIIVNAREHVVQDKELSFAEVVALAFPNPPTGENIVFTVTYRKAVGNKPEGTLIEGASVRVKEGTVFNVTVTDKS